MSGAQRLLPVFRPATARCLQLMTASKMALSSGLVAHLHVLQIPINEKLMNLVTGIKTGALTARVTNCNAQMKDECINRDGGHPRA